MMLGTLNRSKNRPSIAASLDRQGEVTDCAATGEAGHTFILEKSPNYPRGLPLGQVWLCDIDAISIIHGYSFFSN
jgi:hypothetical protein